LNPMHRRKFLQGAVAAPFVSALGSLASQAQAWPSRNVTMINPFPPGGQADLAARPVAAALEKILGRAVVVENRQGAGGAIGNAAAARAEPDGHTLLMTLSSVVILPEADRLFDRKPSYELDQLVPIARVLADPGVLPVLSTSPYKTLQDLIDDAKQRPGQITFSSSGNYGAAHVPYEMFQQAAGIKLQHVPYRGGGPALAAFLGGQVDITAQAPGPVKPYVDEGRVRLLASWGGKRTPELADIPTFIELGFPGVEYYIWAGLFVPKGTPAPIIARLRDAMRDIMQNPQVISVFEKAGSPPAYLDQPDFVRFIEADAARLIPAVKKIGRLDSP
jgi:tripartite-type tricarboxylate transporter receptor subunit TctC